MPKCPHCNEPIDVQFIKAPPMQSAPWFERGTNTTVPAKSDSSLGELLDIIHEDVLTGKSADFVATTRQRYEQYGAETRMSDKQMEWLRDIASGKTK